MGLSTLVSETGQCAVNWRVDGSEDMENRDSAVNLKLGWDGVQHVHSEGKKLWCDLIWLLKSKHCAHVSCGQIGVLSCVW